MHVCVCVCGYVKYQNPKINREGILMYGCVCVYAWYSNTVKSYATSRMTYTQKRIWIPSFSLRRETNHEVFMIFILRRAFSTFGLIFFLLIVTVKLNEPEHDKTRKLLLHSEDSLCALWVAKDINLIRADRKDSDQTRRMSRLI